MRARSLAAVLLAAVAGFPGCGSDGPKKSASPDEPEIPAADWPQFRRDARGTSSSPDGLRAADAARLVERWSATAAPSTYAQGVAAGGAVFYTTSDVGSVVALDLATGAPRWTTGFDAPTRAECDGRERRPGTWGSAAVHEGVVYAASPDGHLYALDAATGAEQWRARVAAPEPHGELVETSVVISPALRRAYVGVASTAHCDQIPGRVAAVDLATHAVTERTLVPDGRRGAAVWASLAVDDDAALVYVATGNAIGDAPSLPLAQAVVALDARTLEPRGSWQNPTALENADFGASPTLFSAGGRDLVAAASKDGWLYVLDRANLGAGPVWKAELAVVDPLHPGEGGDPLAGFGSIVSPAFANGLLYAAGGRTPAGDPGGVFAFDPATGAPRWFHATPGPVLQPPAVSAEVLAVVAQAEGGATLELLDARTGTPLATFHAGAGSFAPPSFAGGKVLWATFDGTIRALGLP